MNVDSHMLSFLQASLESLMSTTQLDSSFTLHNKQKRQGSKLCEFWGCMGWSSCQTQWRTRYSRFDIIESPNGSKLELPIHHCVFLLSSVSFSRSFAAPPLLVRCWLVRRDDGLKATGGAVGAAAALCPCPSSLFLLFFSSLPLFLFPSPASSAPLFANVPCQSPRSPLSPLFAPFR